MKFAIKRSVQILVISFVALLLKAQPLEQKILPAEIKECLYALVHVAKEAQLPLPGALLELSNQIDAYDITFVLYDECKQMQLITDALTFIRQNYAKLISKVDLLAILDRLEGYSGEVDASCVILGTKGCVFDKDCFSANCGRFNKLRVGSETICGKLDVCGPINGIRNIADLRSYGYFYSNCSYTVNFGDSLTFEQTAIAQDISITPADVCPADITGTRVGSTITLRQSGAYYVVFSAFTLPTSTFGQFSVFKNGVPLPGGSYFSILGLTGQVAFRANAGDTLTVHNSYAAYFMETPCVETPITLLSTATICPASIGNATAAILIIKIAE